MQFLLFDVAVTLVFLLGYLTVVSLQRRRALAVPGAASPGLSREPRAASYVEGGTPGKPGAEAPEPPTIRQPGRGWPRLSHPR